MAHVIARRSLCSRDQVGAIIVDSSGKIVGEGYNGPPQFFDHGDRSCASWCKRAKVTGTNGGLTATSEPILDYSDCPSLHAEANALMMSDRTLRAGGTLYVTSHPCFTCAKLIANSGLSQLVVQTDRPADERNASKSYEFLNSLYVQVQVLDANYEPTCTIGPQWD